MLCIILNLFMKLSESYSIIWSICYVCCFMEFKAKLSLARRGTNRP